LGLSFSAFTIQEVRELDRKKDVDSKGTMTDLLWSDPDDRDGWNTSMRAMGHTFGPEMS
jgi:serine/threonine-protein phosphatase 2A catalytic subunit